MIRRHWLGVIRSAAVMLVAVSGLFAATVAQAETGHLKMKIGVSLFPPLVMQDRSDVGSEPYGFEVELWQAIAEEIGVSSDYEVMPFDELLQRVRAGTLDAGLAGISITDRREASFDFSHHTMDSDIRILVPAKETADVAGLWAMLSDSGFWKWLLYFLFFLVICGHILWLSERGSDAIPDAYYPGIFQAVWFAVVTSTTVGYGDIAPKKWVGKLCSILVMLAGIALSGIFIGHITTAMTVDRLESEISSLRDLRGQPVATVSNTTSAKLLEQSSVRLVTVEKVDEALVKLERGQVKAVVFDSPPLMHYVKNEGAGKAVLVGPTLNREYYGIALPTGSAWRERVNCALTKLRRNGVYDALYRKWFGSPQT